MTKLRMTKSTSWVVLAFGLWLGCGSDNGMMNMEPDGSSTTPDAMPDSAIDPNLIIPPPDQEGCHAIYAQDHVPTFELTVTPEEWAGLYDDWIHGVENEELEDMGVIETYHPYHPLAEFRYGDVVITDAHIRLRGNPVYWQDQNKMQFQISFNEGKKGRFLGLRKVLFDAASKNRSFLRDRLALAMLRDLGITAPCANHARVFVNGEYYGLFTNIEKIDKEFLQRNFTAYPEGDLWKRANWVLKTNKLTSTDERLDALRDATTVAELEALMDLEQAMLVWAAEAVIPNSDGFWAGGLNFYLYDDPIRDKFVVLPWDFDNILTRLDYDVDPVTWRKDVRFHGRPWYDLALSDPDWFDYYINTIAHVRAEGYVPEEFSERIDLWTEQIKEAAFADLNKPFSNRKYLEEVEDVRQYIYDRAGFIDEWLLCWQTGGVNDGTGHCVMPQ